MLSRFRILSPCGLFSAPHMGFAQTPPNMEYFVTAFHGWHGGRIKGVETKLMRDTSPESSLLGQVGRELGVGALITGAASVAPTTLPAAPLLHSCRDGQARLLPIPHTTLQSFQYLHAYRKFFSLCD